MQQVLFYLSLFTIITTMIPFIRNDHWTFRVFEYPRLQKLALNTALLILNICFLPGQVHEIVVVALLVLNFIYLLYLVLPFTVLGRRQVASSQNSTGGNNISLLIANVFQDNTQSKKYMDLILRCDPDVVLMVETNLWWQQQMDPITEAYPYQLKMPLENTYGMLFYSRLELRHGHINFLVKKDIPSMHLEVRLPSGQWVRLYCLHPEPPVPQENPKSTERDKEILMVAKMAGESELPVIVMGDLNDVAWSYTTELFSKVSRLLDPRRGRGFFNSFNARYFFLRFPLDHIFCSADFSLTSIRRMENCGSDHFPMFVNLQYDPASELSNEAPLADQQDVELAEKKIAAHTDSRTVLDVNI